MQNETNSAGTKPASLPAPVLSAPVLAAPVSLTFDQAKLVNGGALTVGSLIKIYGGYPPMPELA